VTLAGESELALADLVDRTVALAERFAAGSASPA